MGFVTSSSTIQLYAYMTQYARERILNGNEEEYKITHFSLHDDDINYKVAKNEIGTDATGGTIYNLVSSGFIPDITGDIDNCVKSLSKGVTIKGSYLTAPTPSTQQTYTITTDKSSVNKNETVKYTITTQNVPNGNLYWETDSTTSPASTSNSNDFSDSVSNGIVQIINGTGSINRTILNNYASSVDKTIVLRLRSGSATGVILKTAPTVTINNTSSSQTNQPTYAIYLNSNPTINRTSGKSSLRTAIFQLITTNVPDGTVFYWVNIGTTNASDFTDGTNSGQLLPIVGTSTTLSKEMIQLAIPQSTETITIGVKTSPTGAIVATSPTITVN
jgi:hypothetical protein